MTTKESDFSTPFETTSPTYSMYQALKDLCLNNADYFQGDDSESGQRLQAGFLALIDHINIVAPLVDNVRKIAPQYDFDSKTPGNGYRSFTSVVDMCVLHGVKLNRQVCENRDSFLFRKTFYMKEIEACSHVMASLGTCMGHLKTLISWSTPGELFPGEKRTPEDMLKQSENINMYCFYGRCLGFQFCESMQKILKTISICMASFSEIYYSNQGLLARATNSVWSGGKYFFDPELKARRIVNISQYASVDFCKSFWLLSETELMSRLPSIVCPTVSVNKVIDIPPEPLESMNSSGGKISIPVPTSHLGPGPVHVRLLSAVRREGMIGEGIEKSKTTLPPSPGLIIHCHGGGFVAQSSRSHEMYLRDWACQLGVPIISVDYSLAPEAPFPRALEEVFYAYCWALKNSRILGSTAEKVLLVGDSAGANLNLGAAMKCIELGLRPPDGLFLAYVPTLVSFVPSPSRLLCLMDPLLPFGFMIRCLKAYACPPEVRDKTTSKDSLKSSTNSFKALVNQLSKNNKEGSPNSLIAGSDTESFEEVSESDLLELAAHKSPMSDVGSDTLTTLSIGSFQSKPEVDQAVRLAQQTNRNSDENINSEVSNSSQLYVSEFLDKYVLDTSIDSEGRMVPVLRTEPAMGSENEENVLFEITQEVGLSTKLERAVGNLASGVSNTLNFMSWKKSSCTDSYSDIKPQNETGNLSLEETLDPSQLDSLMQRSPSEEFQFYVPKDPYLSPYWASDEVLQQLPAISILSVQLDPCLDDCVMFAKRLKSLGNSVTLDVLDGLPHGFLNFSMLSKEAHAGSNLCVKRIQELLTSNLT